MAHFDLPLAELEQYRPRIDEPDGLDAFWERTLAETREFPLDLQLTEVENHLALVTTYDVTYSGFGGTRVKAWLHVPAGAAGPLPAVVEFLGYSGGRGLPHQHMSYALAGYAHLVMDTRGQGWGWRAGDTPDDVPTTTAGAVPGSMTRGIESPETYFYRRVFADAVRAVDAAMAAPLVDPARVAVAGGSQGGGIAIAAAALHPQVAAALVDVPFLCHFPRALTLTDNDPYHEVVRFLARYHEAEEAVMRTLAHVDGAVLAARATAPTLFSVALMDATCPPSTVFAAFNRWGGQDKRIAVYPFNQHEGGDEHHQVRKYAWLAERLRPTAV
ncbi:acetylxylan esterase [Cellulomonas marina]|uniref:Cephalosporin-C deacetylase n=1 Tax=Cellulomonas marina TaxID=988821 RepID=A0A1I0YZT9_9CELL|nr:alpha/beta fold hydrolase [Cellulomonas marina]GIG28112.1 acetylxylan esterase [Cellulomonas marina]SFB18366.1 cephalosporin-C deacetylase [Cellulomonas marina]